MGAWSEGPFGNDDALDWLMTFFRTRGLLAVDQAFDAVELVSADFLDAPSASEAWASAEMLAALAGRPGSMLPRPLAWWAWLNRWRGMATTERKARAVRVLSAIRRESELAALWQESGAGEQWQSSIQDLQRRLGGGGTPSEGEA